MTSWRRFSLLLMITVFIGAFVPELTKAQAGVEVVPEDPEYIFAEQMTFRSFLSSQAGEFDDVFLIIQVNGESDVRVHPVTLDRQGNGVAFINLEDSPFAAFSDFEYWYQVDFPGGETYISPTYTFTYTDNRFSWRTLEGDPFRIHWYVGDITFGEQVLNVALEGLQKTQDLLGIYFPEQLDIYVYDDALALQAALPKNNQKWVAGHAEPIYSVILVSLPQGPDQLLEMERQIPHEMMHIALNYTDANAFANLPTWLNEGLASMVELYPNPEYQALIENAYDSGNLFPIASLCSSFPNENQDALLAYAESASFTRYIYEQYGNPGFNRLMAAYASGMNCERGVEQALGLDLDRLDGNWRREDFSSQVWSKAVRDFLPWLVVLAAILIGPVILAVIIYRRRPERTDL